MPPLCGVPPLPRCFLAVTSRRRLSRDSCFHNLNGYIICWHDLYLTKKLAEADSEDRRQALLLAVRHGSVVTWHHITLQGEYDFTDEKLQDSLGLLVSELWTVQWF